MCSAIIRECLETQAFYISKTYFIGKLQGIAWCSILSFCGKKTIVINVRKYMVCPHRYKKFSTRICLRGEKLCILGGTEKGRRFIVYIYHFVYFEFCARHICYLLKKNIIIITKAVNAGKRPRLYTLFLQVSYFHL